MDPRALLDELMGKDRDLPLNQQKKKRLRFDDPEVCHYHLVGFCPHDLFPNTKSDLGACERIHDDSLKGQFLKSNQVSHYEAEFLGYLERLIADLERKIKRCHERLDKEMPLTDQARANSDRISTISTEVQALLKQAEREGEDGMVDLAQATMSKVENLNKEKDQLLRSVVPEFGSILEKERRMQVCEVCGAMQASTDTEKRLASHLEGKQHLGYHRIRETAEHLRKKKEEERELRRRDRDAEKSDGTDSDKLFYERAELPRFKRDLFPSTCQQNCTWRTERDREFEKRRERREPATTIQERTADHELGTEDSGTAKPRNSPRRVWDRHHRKGREIQRRDRDRARLKEMYTDSVQVTSMESNTRHKDKDKKRERPSYGGQAREYGERDGGSQKDRSWTRHPSAEKGRS
eukprot:TRINITY_DN1551_c0_g1_i1.p1 TRINITY_DN1551_c0_g1~~TRINITY_DN1551_c0_g1_i1.p1  ORF type:complete len:421 (+),score=89.86 TRINITY_DN1551_c0_g1_i1:41-1264(+)